MPAAAPKRSVLQRLRVALLFTLFLGLWTALWLLNRPEPTYADQPLSYWLERMADERSSAEAASVLAEMGPEALPALREALRTDSSFAKETLYSALARLRLMPPRNYDEPNVRATAAYLLGQMGETAAPAIGDLVKALGDEDPLVRYRAGAALSHIGMVAAGEVAHALDDPEPMVRYGAAKALGGMGGEARYMAPALMARLSDPQRIVREAAFRALAQIGERAQKEFGPENVPHLVEALTNSPWAVSRKFAVKTLAKIGPGAKPAIPALTSARQSSPELAAEIQEALVAITK